MGELQSGIITAIDQYGVTVRCNDAGLVRNAFVRQYDEVIVEFKDGRHITPEQRKKAWALMTDIATWSGNGKDEVYAALKYDFTVRTVDTFKKHLFRLSQADITTARAFIDFCVDFMLEHGVPSREPIQKDLQFASIERYVYSCVMHRTCACCGKSKDYGGVQVDIHHVSRVGMGRNRDEIDHIGMDILPLCRQHHQEAHQYGDEKLMEKYHITTVKVDDQIVKKYKLGKREKKNAEA